MCQLMTPISVEFWRLVSGFSIDCNNPDCQRDGMPVDEVIQGSSQEQLSYQNTASRLPKILATLMPVLGSSGIAYE